MTTKADKLKEAIRWREEDALRTGKQVAKELARRAEILLRNFQAENLNTIRYELDMLMSHLEMQKRSIESDVQEIEKIAYALNVMDE